MVNEKSESRTLPRFCRLGRTLLSGAGAYLTFAAVSTEPNLGKLPRGRPHFTGAYPCSAITATAASLNSGLT